MHDIIWSRPALEDLRRINDWLTRDAEPDHAIRTLAAIRRRAEFLEQFPHGGRPLRDGVRVLLVYETPYLIRYRIATSRVDVLRVHHERENWVVGS
jgi:plasmid stabilization system protein ParE